MKVGTIVLLAIGILLARPIMEAPAISSFAASGTGPVFAGSLFPFLFITIACRCAVGFPLADLLGHHAQAAGEGKPDAADRLRRHADRVVRRDHWR